MELDVDKITTFLNRVSPSNFVEFNEQEDMSTDSTSTPSSVKKWEDQYGLGRGKANTIDSKSVWNSGRTMGKTYGGSKYKWYTGIQRGVANPAQES